MYIISLNFLKYIAPSGHEFFKHNIQYIFVKIFPVSRLGDSCSGHSCFSPRPIITSSENVLINSIGCARQTDKLAIHACSNSSHDGNIVGGNPTVLVNGLPIAHITSQVNCGSIVIEGSSDVVTAIYSSTDIVIFSNIIPENGQFLTSNEKNSILELYSILRAKSIDENSPISDTDAFNEAFDIWFVESWNLGQLDV